jgi:predicted esterase
MNPHEGQRVLRAGAPMELAKAAVILIHGRGATAEDICAMGVEASEGVSDVALFAPQAAGNEWYPKRFLAPLEENEPYLTSALGVIGKLIDGLGSKGLGPQKVVIAGFSQGACLALEFAARNARRYGGVAGLSGSLIGPPGGPRPLAGNLAGTPFYLGCGDRDHHIPRESVEESAKVLGTLGAAVTQVIFPGMGHTVNAQELDAVRKLISDAAS